jgi:hypothetical protein
MFNLFNIYFILIITGIYFKNTLSTNNGLIKEESKDNITYDMQEDFFSECMF